MAIDPRQMRSMMGRGTGFSNQFVQQASAPMGGEDAILAAVERQKALMEKKKAAGMDVSGFTPGSYDRSTVQISDPSLRSLGYQNQAQVDAMFAALNRMRGINTTMPAQQGDTSVDLDGNDASPMDLVEFDESGAPRAMPSQSLGRQPSRAEMLMSGGPKVLGPEFDDSGEFDGGVAEALGQATGAGLQIAGTADMIRKARAIRPAISAMNTATSAAAYGGGGANAVRNAANAVNAMNAAKTASAAATRLNLAAAGVVGANNASDDTARIAENVAELFFDTGNANPRYFPKINAAEGLDMNNPGDRDIFNFRNSQIYQMPMRGMRGFSNAAQDMGQWYTKFLTGTASGLTGGISDYALGQILPEGAMDYAGVNRDPFGYLRTIANGAAENISPEMNNNMSRAFMGMGGR